MCKFVLGGICGVMVGAVGMFHAFAHLMVARPDEFTDILREVKDIKSGVSASKEDGNA